MSRIGGYLQAGVLAASLLAGTAACAPTRYRPYSGVRDYPDDAQYQERTAYDNGYRRGLAQGDNDARSGRAFSIERHDDYRDADNGYRREYGPKARYQTSFREGYRRGYSEAFNRSSLTYRRAPEYPAGRYPAYGGYTASSHAAQTGYRDGYDAGRDDARDHHAFEPGRLRKYRSADHDYDRRYGGVNEYKREYRTAFERGYEEGYRTYRR
jgi:hypothetical protein